MVLIVLLLLPLLSNTAPTERECCQSKTVGGVDYRFIREENTDRFHCISNCTYERTDKPGQNYCFKTGDLEVHCRSGSENETEYRPSTGETECKDPGAWSLWSSCTCNDGSKEDCTCGGGKRTHSRVCSNGDQQVVPKDCQTNPCPPGSKFPAVMEKEGSNDILRFNGTDTCTLCKYVYANNDDGFDNDTAQPIWLSAMDINKKGYKEKTDSIHGIICFECIRIYAVWLEYSNDEFCKQECLKTTPTGYVTTKCKNCATDLCNSNSACLYCVENNCPIPGTPIYIAPEYCHHLHSPNATKDVYVLKSHEKASSGCKETECSYLQAYNYSEICISKNELLSGSAIDPDTYFTCSTALEAYTPPPSLTAAPIEEFKEINTKDAVQCCRYNGTWRRSCYWCIFYCQVGYKNMCKRCIKWNCTNCNYLTLTVAQCLEGIPGY